MIKLGILDFDTSHVTAFADRLSHKNVPMDQWVDGAQIVVGCAGDSKISPERIPGYVEAIKKLGIPLVEKPEEMIGKVDGMLIESQEGGVHLERARPFLEKGIPCYIDKPFTCSSRDAKKIFELARTNKTVVFSSSSLRYTPELVAFNVDKSMSKVQGVLAYGPCPLFDANPKLNPGLYHYGIHAVEILYTLMGPGCTRVTSAHEKGVDVVTGHWSDGRVATVRGIRAGKSEYGALVFTDKGVVPLTLNTKYIYKELLKKIVEMFQSKKSPVEEIVTIEIMAFIEAANKSGINHGSVELLQV